MIRRIRDLLYDQGFTISGARNKMQEILQLEREKKRNGEVLLDGVEVIETTEFETNHSDDDASGTVSGSFSDRLLDLRRELFEIRSLLSLAH